MTRRPSFRAGPRSQALDRALKLSRYLAAAAATALLLQLRFSADGNFLYTGARRDAALQCWDLRHASGEEQWMGGRVGGWGGGGGAPDGVELSFSSSGSFTALHAAAAGWLSC